MTEEEWLACEDPEGMLEFLRGKASDRKLRLFACACCRRVWHLLDDERGRHAIELGEQCAEGKLTLDDAYSAAKALAVFEPMEVADRLSEERGIYWEAISLSIFAAGMTTGWLDTKQTASISQNVASAIASQALASSFDTREAYDEAAAPYRLIECTAQTQLLRDIFPFHPITLSPSWLTSTVVSLANQMYDSRDFSAMPILADALRTHPAIMKPSSPTVEDPGHT